MDSDALRAAPKQRRGRERVEAILNAASEVIAEVGYEQATIGAIAARSNTATGSLYQFFANKEAILKALVDRYVARASAVFAAMEVESYPVMTLQDGIRAMLVPLKAFIRDNRDFQAIFSSSTGSAIVAESIRAMDEGFLARNDAALAAARPNLDAHDRRKYGLVCMMIMKGLLGLAHPGGELTLDEVFEEMEAVFLRYLLPVVGE
ncbi:MAG: TetR/AcrR family transcriptional regulator [Chloroflexi bacterium]|nr:TetR/AcrR family transcriptional regulator [Chloroflexota bacterium]